MTGGLGADQRAAMPADVMKALDRPVLAAHDDERIGIQFKRDVIARPGDFAAMAGKKPALPPDAFEVGAIDGLVRIKRAG